MTADRRAIVVDASVAVAWFLPEQETPVAECLLEGTRRLLAPDLLAIEVANALLTQHRRGRYPLERIIPALDSLRAIPLLTIARSADLLDAAVQVAGRHGHPVYDCLYLALAEREDAVLATFDRRLTALARLIETPLWAAPEPA